MPNLNKVMLMGNLTRDPELRKTPKGTSVAEVGLAINRYFLGDDGVRREETAFVDVTLWGRSAEVVCQYSSKGRALYVEGRLQLDSWEDRSTGQQRSKLKVVAESIQLLGSREGGEPPTTSGYESSGYQSSGHQGGSGYSSGGSGSYAQRSHYQAPPQSNTSGYPPQPQQVPQYAPPQYSPPPAHQPPSPQPPSHQPPSHQPPSHQPPSHQPPSHQPTNEPLYQPSSKTTAPHSGIPIDSDEIPF